LEGNMQRKKTERNIKKEDTEKKDYTDKEGKEKEINK
jgi:hypothetical protein